MSNVEILNDIELDIGNPKNNLKLFKFTERDFSTKVGNNYNPGKYSDLELYSMNLITDQELITRKTEEYEKLLEDEIITEDDFIRRTTNPIEVAREIQNVKRYYEFENGEFTGNDYFTGEIKVYTIDNIRESARSIREMAKPDNDYKALFVIVTDQNVSDIYQGCEQVIDYFSANENKTNPYNFYSATEGKATFSFTVESNFSSNSVFSDSEFREAFNSNGNSNYVENKNFINRNHIINFSVINNKFVVLNTSTTVKNYVKTEFYRDHHFRLGIQKLLLNKFDYDIDFITFTTHPDQGLPFIFANTPRLKEGYRGSITLTRFNNIFNGPMLHEIVHYFCNHITEAQSCVVSKAQRDITYNGKTYTYMSYDREYPHSNMNGPHWGFTNTPGQLGGFDESRIIEIFNNTNFPINENDIGPSNSSSNLKGNSNENIYNKILSIEDNRDINNSDTDNETPSNYNYDYNFKISNIELNNLSEQEKLDLKQNIIRTIRENLNITNDTIIDIKLESGSIKVNIQIENLSKESSEDINSKKNLLINVIENNLKNDDKLKNIPNISDPDIGNTNTKIVPVNSSYNYNNNESSLDFRIVILVIVSFVIIGFLIFQIVN